MIKLLKITKNEEAQRIDLEFSEGQSATLYKFGKDWISDTSDWVTKNSLKEIKQELIKGGDLDKFIGKDFVSYFEKI